ncbi:glycine C-acetyltransferase [Balneolales bacterium ANBcel1]|nr:glycine C-acetyltransferase [Balneolales bacterium ANBcel1]
MYGSLQKELQKELATIREDGLYKTERVLTSPQGADVTTDDGREVINFCANNYLGLSSHPRIVEAAKSAVDKRGFGLSSVRFICGTQDIHRELERKIADFVGMEDAILYAAAFDANGGVFEPLFGPEDAIISDQLNHASIIDGVRLTKSRRYVYKNNDMVDLEARLKEASDARHRIIVTDGVFSMDGTIAQLDKICDLADRYDALVMSDECHATGFVGPTGRGVHEYHNVMGRVDIITGTFGKALGGASGGFTASHKEVIDLLRQRSRPYLFSNTVAPAVVGGSIAALDLLESTGDLRKRLMENTRWFRSEMACAGFDIPDGEHPIVPVMLYDAKIAQKFAADLLNEGIYVTGFYYPVVPKGRARIRVQLSAVHEQAHLERAVTAFRNIGNRLGVI